jgi:tetratricopeptide (TPR) repeat protein
MKILTVPLVFSLLSAGVLPALAAPLHAQETAEHYTALGDASFARKDYDAAITSYSKAIEIDSKYIPAYLKRAATNAATGEWDVVMTDVSAAALFDPKNPAVYDARGNYRRVLPDPDVDGAIADHKKAIELDPKSGDYHADLAADLEAKGDAPGAIAAYTDAIALDPKDAISYTGRGILLDKKGDHDGAIADFNKAIELSPDAAAPYEARSAARAAKGDKAGAAADHKQAKKLQPKAEPES